MRLASHNYNLHLSENLNGGKPISDVYQITGPVPVVLYGCLFLKSVKGVDLFTVDS